VGKRLSFGWVAFPRGTVGQKSICGTVLAQFFDFGFWIGDWMNREIHESSLEISKRKGGAWLLIHHKILAIKVP
jgi:hypothetical protein